MPDDDSNEREGRPLAMGPLGSELAKMPLRYAAGVLIAASCGTAVRARTATATLVDTGAQKLAVTCSHVMTAYRDCRAEFENTTFQLGDLHFDPMPRIVAESATLDLVTINLDGLDLRRISDHPLIGTTFYTPKSWPPRRVNERDVVSFAGFPERWRDFPSRAEVLMSSFSIGTVFVSAVSEDQFGIILEREYWVEPFNHDNREPLHHFSGMSGSPVVMERQNGVRRFEVVGVAKEFSETFDYVVVAHMCLVLPNGAISL